MCRHDTTTAPARSRGGRAALPIRAVSRHYLALVALVAGLAGLTVSPAHYVLAAYPASQVYGWGAFGNNGRVSPVVDRPTPVPGIPGTVVQVATSNSDTYALTSTGTVWAWGVGTAGELGDGGTSNSFSAPVEVSFPPGVSIASLPEPMPFDTALAIDTHGDVWGWGLNQDDGLCLGSASEELVPVELPFTGVTLATGAGDHALYYSNDTLYACGQNDVGQLGTGNTLAVTGATEVVGLPEQPIASLTSSWEGSGALLSDGSYYDWGFNKHGQLGDGNTTNSSKPVLVDLEASVRQVSQGGSDPANGQTVAILSNRTVWAWGTNTYGQLGDDSTASSSTPVSVDLPAGEDWTSVVSGGSSCYALDSQGDLWAWGQDEAGALGNGAASGERLEPTAIEGVSGLKEVSATSFNEAAYASGFPGPA